MSDTSILILNGPGLSDFSAFADDALGITSINHIEAQCVALGKTLNARIDFRQSDDQDEIIRWIETDASTFDALIINQLGCTERAPVDYPRYCKDLDILATLSCPVTEIHMTNVLRHDRGAFQSLRGPEGNTALVCGLGADSYDVAIRAAVPRLPVPASVEGNASILILNGPNLNLLGTREPEIYGSDTLDDVARRCLAFGQAEKTRNSAAGIDIDFRQSNYEGQLVEWIQQAIGRADALIINAAAYTHTSVALHDALKSYDGLSLELHISNPHMREAFRHTSYVSTAVEGVIMGLGTSGYEHAVQYALKQLIG